MKIYLDAIGCRLNQSEIEIMARQFEAAGHEVVGSPQIADMAVVNTCAVTTQAASDSRGRIRSLARAGVNQIIPTGCWVTLQPKDAATLPNVLQVVSNAHKERLVPDLLGLPGHAFDLEPLSRTPLPGLHHRTRAFIKVQDGCDNRCTFCITTIARGNSRSRSIGEVIRDIQLALTGGTKEIVLTGVHLGSWGQESGKHIRDLVMGILKDTDVPRIRLSSLEPWDLDADFFSLWENRRLMPHLHLPLQSGSESTLKRMARKTSPRSFRDLVAAARSIIPEVAVTTDLIAGFPGENDAEFHETLEFVKDLQFAGGHVFTYSPRPGTPAEKMKGQITPPVGKERNRILQKVLEESAHSYRRRFLGRRVSVLWESILEYGEYGWRMEGWSENHLRVAALAFSPRWNELDQVELVELNGSTLDGVIQDSG